MTKKKELIDINKMFDEEQTDFLPSLNEEIKNGMAANKLQVNDFEEVETEYGKALRIELLDLETEIEYSFLVSGKVFRKLFESNVSQGSKIRIFLNEKSHWRFEFVQ